MAYLHRIGHFHPETVRDNKFLVDLDIGVDEERILQRVGIRERRAVLDLITSVGRATAMCAPRTKLQTTRTPKAASLRPRWPFRGQD